MIPPFFSSSLPSFLSPLLKAAKIYETRYNEDYDGFRECLSTWAFAFLTGIQKQRLEKSMNVWVYTEWKEDKDSTFENLSPVSLIFLPLDNSPQFTNNLLFFPS